MKIFLTKQVDFVFLHYDSAIQTGLIALLLCRLAYLCIYGRGVTSTVGFTICGRSSSLKTSFATV